MFDDNQIQSVMGNDVYGSDGEKIGRAGQVYVDDQTGRPEWVTVNTGLFGMNESFVPLGSADLGEGRVTVNDEPESRRGRQLVVGDVVELGGVRSRVASGGGDVDVPW